MGKLSRWRLVSGVPMETAVGVNERRWWGHAYKVAAMVGRCVRSRKRG